MTEFYDRRYIVRWAIVNVHPLRADKGYPHDIGHLWFDDEGAAHDAWGLIIKGSRFVNADIYDRATEEVIADWSYKDQPEWKELMSHEEEPYEEA